MINKLPSLPLQPPRPSPSLNVDNPPPLPSRSPASSTGSVTVTPQSNNNRPLPPPASPKSTITKRPLPGPPSLSPSPQLPLRAAVSRESLISPSGDSMLEEKKPGPVPVPRARPRSVALVSGSALNVASALSSSSDIQPKDKILDKEKVDSESNSSATRASPIPTKARHPTSCNVSSLSSSAANNTNNNISERYSIDSSYKDDPEIKSSHDSNPIQKDVTLQQKGVPLLPSRPKPPVPRADGSKRTSLPPRPSVPPSLTSREGELYRQDNDCDNVHSSIGENDENLKRNIQNTHDSVQLYNKNVSSNEGYSKASTEMEEKDVIERPVYARIDKSNLKNITQNNNINSNDSMNIVLIKESKEIPLQVKLKSTLDSSSHEILKASDVSNTVENSESKTYTSEVKEKDPAEKPKAPVVAMKPKPKPGLKPKPHTAVKPRPNSITKLPVVSPREDKEQMQSTQGEKETSVEAPTCTSPPLMHTENGSEENNNKDVSFDSIFKEKKQENENIMKETERSGQNFSESNNQTQGSNPERPPDRSVPLTPLKRPVTFIGRPASMKKRASHDLESNPLDHKPTGQIDTVPEISQNDKGDMSCERGKYGEDHEKPKESQNLNQNQSLSDSDTVTTQSESNSDQSLSVCKKPHFSQRESMLRKATKETHTPTRFKNEDTAVNPER